jgi:hypothetical protein
MGTKIRRRRSQAALPRSASTRIRRPSGGAAPRPCCSSGRADRVVRVPHRCTRPAGERLTPPRDVADQRPLRTGRAFLAPRGLDEALDRHHRARRPADGT